MDTESFYLGSRLDWLLFSASGAQHDGADSRSAAEHTCCQLLEGNMALGGKSTFCRSQFFAELVIAWETMLVLCRGRQYRPKMF